MGITSLDSKDELQKVLAIQKSLSEFALAEIARFAGADPEVFVRQAAKVLEKYARYSTLTEFKKMPHLADSEKWGATFGVTTIVGSLILEQSRQLLRVASDLRLEYLRFLADLDERGTGAVEMNTLNRIFAVLSESYGVIWTQDDKISLTVVGRRVYLHLLDAMKFVDEAREATIKFASKA